MLNQIQEALEKLDKNVFYGLSKEMNEWNYICFSRTKTKPATQRTSKTQYYSVAVVRENYILEDVEDKVIEAMTALPGMRVGEEISYSYVKKPNTNTIIEIMEIPFSRAVKK